MKRKAFSTNNDRAYDFLQSLKKGAVPSTTVFLSLISFFTLKSFHLIIIDKEQYEMVFSNANSESENIFTLFLLTIGIVSGLYVFRFLQNRQEQNVLLSLGLKRSRLLFNRCAALVLEMFLAVSIPLILTLLINISAYGLSIYSFKVCVFFITALFSIVLVGFAIGTLSAVLAGTKIEGGLTALSLSVLPMGLLLFFYTCFRFFLKGYKDKFESGISLFPIFDFFNSSTINENVLRRLNPLTMTITENHYDGIFSMYSNIYTEDSPLSFYQNIFPALKTSEFSSFFSWILIAVCILLLCSFLLNRRKLENTGMFKRSKIALSIIISTITLYSSGFGLAFGIFKARDYMKIGQCTFFALDAYGKFLTLSHILLYAVVALFICFFLYTQNVKRLIHSLRFLPLAFLALIVPFVCITGGLGFSTRTPNEGVISKISLEYPFAPNEKVFLQTRNGKNEYPVRYSGFDSLNDKNLIFSLNKSLAKSRSKMQPYSVTIRYTLANGKEVVRYYPEYSDDVLLKLTEIFDSDTIKDYFYKRLVDKDSHLSKEELLNLLKENSKAHLEMPMMENNLYKFDKVVAFELKSTETEKHYIDTIKNLDKDKYEQFLEAIAADYRNMSAADYYFPKEPCKYIVKLGIKNDEPNELSATDFFILHIHSAMKNTLSVLESIKISGNQNAKTIKKIAFYDCTVNMFYIQRFDTLAEDEGAKYIASLESKDTAVPYAVYENSKDIADFSGKLHTFYAVIGENASYALVTYSDNREAIYILAK